MPLGQTMGASWHVPATCNFQSINPQRQNALRIDAKRGLLTSLVPEPVFGHELEQVVYKAADESGGNRVADVSRSSKEAVTRIADELKAHGLVVDDAHARKAVIIPLLLPNPRRLWQQLRQFVRRRLWRRVRWWLRRLRRGLISCGPRTKSDWTTQYKEYRQLWGYFPFLCIQ